MVATRPTTAPITPKCQINAISSGSLTRISTTRWRRKIAVRFIAIAIGSSGETQTTNTGASASQRSIGIDEIQLPPSTTGTT